jgi:hypothetical protein
MATHHVLRSVLLTTGMLMLAGCASTGALDERYFQAEAKNYQKFQYQGQILYCQNDKEISSLIPYKKCMTEPALHQAVANARRSRNPVERGGPAYVSSVPGNPSGR